MSFACHLYVDLRVLPPKLPLEADLEGLDSFGGSQLLMLGVERFNQPMTKGSIHGAFCLSKQCQNDT